MVMDRIRGRVVHERVDIEQVRARSINVATTSVAFTLSLTTSLIHFINNQSTADIVGTLPTFTPGLMFHLFNTATQSGGTITFSDTAAAAVIQLGQNEGGFVASTSAAWRGYVGLTS